MNASLFKKKEIRALIVGLDYSGKTTILYRLKLGELITTIPTIGFNVETVEISNGLGRACSVVLWDIVARPSFALCGGTIIKPPT